MYHKLMTIQYSNASFKSLFDVFEGLSRLVERNLDITECEKLMQSYKEKDGLVMVESRPRLICLLCVFRAT